MNFVKSEKLSENDLNEVFHLWNKEYPRKLTYNSISELENYLSGLKEQTHILVTNEENKIKGWYFDFVREGEKWFGLLIDSDNHKMGLGTKMLNLAKKKERELNGWVIDHSSELKSDGKLYKSPLNFYLKNGFKQYDGVVLKNNKLSAIKITWIKGESFL